ncbi:putative AgrB-like protein [Clostridium bornimense]|uniref:Putative AgrB-like protein n=1 Tax=Clostridium bornimense TaxID=1216932 RepID=W6RUI3_9CLOT|nr:accessory gene regulator B family protein [Clostridium bornimense]CDM67958.1 putative AgrB-like protein [Clostridium bornimense]
MITYEKIADKISSKIIDTLDDGSMDTEKLSYGILVFFINITKLIILLIGAYFFDVMLEFFIIIFSFAIMRLSNFGLHLKGSLFCTVVSFISFIGSALICKFLHFDIYMIIISYIVLILLTYMYAPADTESNPLCNTKQRKKFKFQSICKLLIFFFISLLFNNYMFVSCIIFGNLISTITILPITYDLFKLSKNNYELYEEYEP